MVRCQRLLSKRCVRVSRQCKVGGQVFCLALRGTSSLEGDAQPRYLTRLLRMGVLKLAPVAHKSLCTVLPPFFFFSCARRCRNEGTCASLHVLTPIPLGPSKHAIGLSLRNQVYAASTVLMARKAATVDTKGAMNKLIESLDWNG